MLHLFHTFSFTHCTNNLKTFARSFAHKNISKYSVHWQRVADWLNADAGFQVNHMYVDTCRLFTIISKLTKVLFHRTHSKGVKT